MSKIFMSGPDIKECTMKQTMSEIENYELRVKNFIKSELLSIEHNNQDIQYYKKYIIHSEESIRLSELGIEEAQKQLDEFLAQNK